MSINGVTGYGYYPQTSCGAYYNPAFQGTTTQETEEKGVNKGLIAAGVGAAAAVGTTLYALKKGKGINGADGTLLKNLKSGFETIGKSVSKAAGEAADNVKSLFKKQQKIQPQAK